MWRTDGPCFDPHYQLLTAVIYIGGDYNFAARAGKLLDCNPGKRAMNQDLVRSLESIGFLFTTTKVPLGQSPEFYLRTHELITWHLRILRIHPILLVGVRPQHLWPFASRLDPLVQQKFASIILDGEILPPQEDETLRDP